MIILEILSWFIYQPLKFKNIEYPRSEKKLPQIIDKNHIFNCINKIENKKHQAIISLAFSTAMRVSEVCNLKFEDINSKSMLITIFEYVLLVVFCIFAIWKNL